jgi:hypothetical protein
MLGIWGVPAGGSVKTSIVAALAALLLISGAALAQEKAASAKPLTVVGKVSSDLKTLITDIDSEWMVSNPDALKGHEGRWVTVKCYVDTEKNKVQVLSVKKGASDTSYSARWNDSAFRR